MRKRKKTPYQSYNRFMALAFVIALLLTGAALVVENHIFFEHPHPPPELKGFKYYPNETFVPEFTFEGKRGEEISLESFRGGYILVNFWATWCAPCVEEMPSLDRLAGQMLHMGKNFRVVAISQDSEKTRAVRPFFRKQGIENLDLYFDPEIKGSQLFSLRGLPTSILIGPQGNMIGRLAGSAEWDHGTVVQFLAHLVGTGSSPE